MKEPIEIVIESEVKNIEAEIEFSGERIAGGGATFVPAVDADGNLSWSNDGDLPNPETVNIKGPRGEKGEDGKDGAPGKDGYTPIKGVDYFDGEDGKDGYTPVKGVDYFDGEQGVPGYTPQKGVDYFDGQQGEKGDPFTYEDFTPEQLASLKGEKGDKGDPGKDGTGVSILGSYASEAELIAAHPTGNIGDAYMVEGALYVWSATDNAWTNVGNIKGEKGADGYSPTVAVSKSGKVTTVTITDKDGAKTATINDGADGANGKDGESIGIEDYGYGLDNTTVAFTDGSVIQIPNGVGIKNIRLSKESETGNTYKIELTNGQNYEFVAPVGPAGKTGADGSNGKSAYEVACDNGFVGNEEDWLETLVGPKGNNGAHGTHAEHWWEGTVLTVRSASGESSADLKGEKGDTPVKGVDYFTEAEKTEMLSPVTSLAETAKSTADSAKTMAREASFDASEALDLAGDANDTATAAMEAVGNLTALPNPNALTINGVTYNGSSAVDMTATIKALIEAELGVIENGTY